MRLVLLAVLASCIGAPPTVTSSTPRSVTVDHVNSTNIDEATGIAQQECEKNGRDAEIAWQKEPQTVAFRCVDRVVSTRDVAPTSAGAGAPVARPAAAEHRKTATGAKPLYCASTAPEVGLCFLDETACKAEQEKSGAASCELKTAGSCFNATRTLERTKSVVCAVSIKDCETRRAALSADPDYTVSACGVYRVVDK